jgi:ABC-type transport system involved in multi-copper enzyme maturation permease subunit
LTPQTTVTTEPAASADATTAPEPVSAGRPRLVRAELRKITTTNVWWIVGVLLLAATALALLLNVAAANHNLTAAEFARDHPPTFTNDPADQARAEEYARATDIPAILARSAADVYTSGQFFGLLLVVIVGALVVTNEFQHQTATATFLTTPARTRVIAAKLVAAVVLAAGYWLFATGVSVGIGALDFAATGYGVPLGDPAILRAIGMNLLAYAVWAVIGIAFGVLIRGQVVATLTATGLYLSAYPGLFVISLLHDLIQQDWVYDLVVVLPGMASIVMVQTEPLGLGFDTVGPPWWAGAITLVAYGAVAGTIGTLIMRRRDIA